MYRSLFVLSVFAVLSVYAQGEYSEESLNDAFFTLDPTKKITCPANEFYDGSCSGHCDRICFFRGEQNPCTRICRGGCRCEKGLMRNKETGKCVNVSACPGFTQKLYEEYLEFEKSLKSEESEE